MTFEELGATLRSEREKRNLNIDDVANQLKISPRQLRALESGDIASLPHPAYARGFIRSYASWLGMGSGEIQQALESVQTDTTIKPQASTARNVELHIPEPENQKPKKGAKGWLFVIFLCILCGGGYYAWQKGYLDFLDMKKTSNQKMEDTLQSADKYMAAKDASRVAEATATPEGSGAIPESNAVAPAQPPVPLGSGGTVTSPIQSSSMKDEIDRSIAERQSPGESMPQTHEDNNSNMRGMPDQHKLVITAIEECWVHSNADKTDTRQFSLRKGDTFALTFGDSLELKLGNAGGVRLRYDGNDLPPPGTSGQVKTLTFPPKANL